MFVLPDADVELAAKAAWFGSTVNRGQTCIAVRRAFVHRAVYPAFVESLQKQLTLAGPMRLAMEGQVRQAERLVIDATARGGRVLTTAIADSPADGNTVLPAGDRRRHAGDGCLPRGPLRPAHGRAAVRRAVSRTIPE